MALWCVLCFTSSLASAARAQTDGRIHLEFDSSQAEAVLTVLGRRAAGEPVAGSDWERVFGSEPYRRLKRRQAEMKRDLDDGEFRRFVLSDSLLREAQGLERTLADWKRVDLEASARRVLAYLPPQARIRAKVFPVIKQQTNSFVFETKTDPTIFLYLDPAQTAEQFENTVAHELHHIGFASVAGETTAGLESLSARAQTAVEWMGAFGEGMAMLAASGGPSTHPHIHSSPEDRARWERDLANVGGDLRSLERFFLDVIDGRLSSEDQIRQAGFAFFGVQGPWYTVGWQMAVLVERHYGREALIDCMLDPRRLLATYNQAVLVGKDDRHRLPLWSRRLLQAVDARPVGVAASGSARQ